VRYDPVLRIVHIEAQPKDPCSTESVGGAFATEYTHNVAHRMGRVTGLRNTSSKYRIDLSALRPTNERLCHQSKGGPFDQT
jgi:hypothetical protein